MSKVKKAADLAKKAVERLGGTQAERMARAEAMGFDTSRPVYHGTDTDFTEFDPERAIGTQFWSTTDRAAVEAGDVGAQGRGVVKELYHRIKNPAGWKEYDKFGIDELIARGYDGLALPDADGHITYTAFSPNQYRDVNADFNPANIDSPNLLAGIQSAAPIGAGALLAGAALAPEDAEAGVITKGGKRIIEAWHGSPHSFPAERLVRLADGTEHFLVGAIDSLPDIPQGAEVIQDFPLGRFRMDKIGTGEGAQAYGHGLYTADAPETANQYRINLGYNPDDMKIGSEQVNDYYGRLEAKAARLPPDQSRPLYDQMAVVERLMQHDKIADVADYADEIGQGEWFRNEIAPNYKTFGGLYRTHIDVDPDTLLDWDKPLSEQSDAVKSAVAKIQGEYGDALGGAIQGDFSGQYLTQMLRDSRLAGSQQAATEKLRDAGIPGIRYRDQMSRGDTAEPTFNYVMFDDKPISIVERGMATPTALGATAAVTGGTMAAMSPEAEQYRDAPEFEKRLQQIPYPRIDNENGSYSTHLMAAETDENGNWYAFPTIQPNEKGQLQEYPLREAQQRAMQSGNYKAFGTDSAAALRYADGGYKAGTVLEQPQPPDLQYLKDANEAIQAAQSFAQRRAGKSEYWKQKREQLLGLVGKVGDAAVKTLDMPLQGYMGLSAVAGGLASGQGIDAALQQGGRIAAQPTDVTAYQYGQTVTDQLTPYVPPEAAAAAGALVNAGSLLGSPL